MQKGGLRSVTEVRGLPVRLLPSRLRVVRLENTPLAPQLEGRLPEIALLDMFLHHKASKVVLHGRQIVKQTTSIQPYMQEHDDLSAALQLSRELVHCRDTTIRMQVANKVTPRPSTHPKVQQVREQGDSAKNMQQRRPRPVRGLNPIDSNLNRMLIFKQSNI